MSEWRKCSEELPKIGAKVEVMARPSTQVPYKHRLVLREDGSLHWTTTLGDTEFGFKSLRRDDWWRPIPEHVMPTPGKVRFLNVDQALIPRLEECRARTEIGGHYVPGESLDEVLRLLGECLFFAFSGDLTPEQGKANAACYSKAGEALEVCRELLESNAARLEPPLDKAREALKGTPYAEDGEKPPKREKIGRMQMEKVEMTVHELNEVRWAVISARTKLGNQVARHGSTEETSIREERLVAILEKVNAALQS